MDLRELVDTIDVPDTQVAEVAWEQGRRRMVRRRTLAAGAVGLAVAVVFVGASALTPRSAQHPPTPTTQSPQPDPARVRNVPITMPTWSSLADIPVSDPASGTVPLSEDPMSRATLVVNDPGDDAGAYVLGDDGGWRRVDVPGLQPVTHGSYTRSVVWPGDLSPDATELAIPQPSALVVVDLTTGSSTRFDVGGSENHYVQWTDADHVLVVEEGRVRGNIVDVRTGSTQTSSAGPSSRVLPDGSVLTWSGGPGNERYLDGALHWSDGRSVESAANNAAGFFPTPPLVKEGVVVGLHHQLDGMALTRVPTGDPAADGALEKTNGIAAVDDGNGAVLGFLPLGHGKGEESTVLGWVGEDPVLGLVRRTRLSVTTYVVQWDYRAATLQPLAAVPGSWVSWAPRLD